MRGRRQRRGWGLAVAVVCCALLPVREGRAAAVAAMRDIMTRQTVGVVSDHDISFVTPSGVDAPSDTIVLGLPAFSFGAFAATNATLQADESGTCDGPWTDMALEAAAGAGVWGVAAAGTNVTLTAPTDASTGTLQAGSCVRVGLHGFITNPSFAGTHRIDIGGSFGDTGFFWVVTQTSDAVTVTATVPSPTPPTPSEATVRFLGLAYPASNVSIARSGVTLVTVPADPAARFDVTLAHQPTGSAQYTVSAVDPAGRQSSPMNFSMTLTDGVTVTISGLFFGPSIAADETSIGLNDTVTLFGVTVPDSSVRLVIHSEEEITLTTTADGTGAWTRQVLGSDVGAGDHEAKAKSVAPTSEVSEYGPSVAFSVAGAPSACAGRVIADINCDGRVNLTDFSILLYYWKRTDPQNERADINSDGIVNLVDFSILLYYWSS